MTMLTSWKLDPHTVMRLKSGRRVMMFLRGDTWHAVVINHLQAPTLLSLRDSRLERACVSANGSDVYFEAEHSLPKCARNCEK